MNKTMGWKNHLTAGILFVQIILVSILLYILVPLKGLVWVLSFIFQALLSFFFLEAAFGSKNRGAGRRLSVLRHFIVQIVLVSSWCLVGILAKTFFKEHAGWIALITCLLITCLSYLILPMKWVFGIPGKTRPEEFLLKYDLYLYAFFTVVTLHILLYAIYGVFPFGDNAYLRMDCYHQYTPFLKAFLRRLKTGESLLFTWDNGLGVNYWSHFGYYLSSPSNLLLLLLPEKYLTEGIAAGIVIKGALSACTFLFCLDKKFKGRDVYRFIFGVFYALSAFYIAYSCNIMWADSYVLFPLIMLGIENITKGKKAILYGVSLSLCILSNFYIAAIAGICIVLYFIANLIIHRGGGNVFLSVGRFLYATLTACLIAGIILLPEYLCLKNTAAGDLSFPRSWESYFGFHELIGRMLANVTTIQNNSELPNIYCSVFALLFLPLFFANKKIPLTKKITLGVLVVFLLLSFQWNVLSYVWHGFHYPNSFPGRFSFFFVFLILSMGYESFRMREELNQIAVMVSSGILFAGILVLGFFLSRDDLLNIFTTFVFSAVLVFLYSVLCALDRKRHSLTVRNLLVILLLLEVTVNTLATGINSVVDRSDYLADEKMTAYTTAYLNELTPGFYRMEKTDKEYMNEASFDGYASASYFSSTIFGGVMNFYSKMGLRYSDVAYSYQGGNPLMASVLNIRYQVSGRDEHMGSTYETFPLSNGEGDTDYISRNKYPLSLGFAVPKDSEAVFDTLEDKKPFRNLNAFAKAIGADGNLFTPLSALENTEGTYTDENGKEYDGAAVVYSVPAGKHLFVYVINYLDTVRYINYDSDNHAIDSGSESGLKFRHCMDLGEYDTERNVYLFNGDDPEEKLQFQAYLLDEETYAALMENLSEELFLPDTVEDDHFSGSIRLKEDATVFFSIPYDEGFRIRVDGERAEYKAYGGAFLALDLPAGEHSIEADYTPRGLGAGALLSLAGCILAVPGIGVPRLIESRKG